MQRKCRFGWKRNNCRENAVKRTVRSRSAGFTPDRLDKPNLYSVLALKGAQCSLPIPFSEDESL